MPRGLCLIQMPPEVKGQPLVFGVKAVQLRTDSSPCSFGTSLAASIKETARQGGLALSKCGI